MLTIAICVKINAKWYQQAQTRLIQIWQTIVYFLNILSVCDKKYNKLLNVHPIYHQCKRKHVISCKKDKNFLKNYPKIFLLKIYSIVIQIIYDNLHQNFLTQPLYVLCIYIYWYSFSCNAYTTLKLRSQKNGAAGIYYRPRMNSYLMYK